MRFRIPLLSAAAATIVFTGCMSVDLAGLLAPRLEEVTVESGGLLSFKKIALVDISGVIDTGGRGSLLGGAAGCTPERFAAVLRKIEDDPAVCAVVVRIDSPGGGVTASETLHHELQRLREKRHIPILISMQGLACSGGYYAAVAGDEIYASPTTVTGSIGVIARLPDFRGLADKVGYREELVTSGDMKAMGHPLRQLSERDRAVFQNMIDEMYNRFVDVVQAGRPALSRERIVELADGRVYTAEQAKKVGLVDDIRHLSDVIDRARELADARRASVVSWLPGGTQDPSIYSSTSTRTALMSLPTLPDSSPGFFYLWSGH